MKKIQHYAPELPPLNKEGQGPGNVHQLHLSQKDEEGVQPVVNNSIIF